MANGALTVSRRLVEELKTEICCSESGATCKDNEFCSSNPKEWPVISNDPAKARLIYPSSKKNPSIPGLHEFCSAYESWYQKSDCRLLTRDITGKLSGPGRSVIADSLKDRCSMLYDDDPGGRALNESRAEDLQHIFSFCENVQPQDNPVSFWGVVFKGGGAAGGLALASYIVWKIAKAIKHFGEGFYNVAVGIAKLSDGVDMISKGVKKLFTVALPNLARTMKYVVTLGWLRGKKPPETIPSPNEPLAKKLPEPLADMAPEPLMRKTPAPTAKRIILAHIGVVGAQLLGLNESEHYLKEGHLFASLDPVTREYVAFLAIKMWDEETEEAKRFYIQDDHLLTEGKLPVGFINKFARTVLTERKVPLLSASASVWNERADYIDLSVASADGEGSGLLRIALRPEMETVRAQLASDPRYPSDPPTFQDYLARKAIFIWEEAPADTKIRFIRNGRFPGIGELPESFIESFRKRESLRQIEIMRRAWVFGQIMAQMPELSPLTFNIIDARAKGFLMAWDILPHTIRREFINIDRAAGIASQSEYLPSSFMDFMRPMLRLGTAGRDELQPAGEPWVYYAEEGEKVYKGHAICEIMRHITLLDDGIENYPEILDARASLIVDMWVVLNRRVQARFIVGERGQSGERRISLHLIPPAFISFVTKIFGGFSTGARRALDSGDILLALHNEEDDDPGKTGGNQGPAGGMGTPPIATPASGGAEASAVATRVALDACAMTNINAGAALFVGGAQIASSLIMMPPMMTGL